MELNDDWINNFEEVDKLYQDFYKENLYYITLKYIYVNRENNIEKIIQEPFFMSIPNYISREEILQIIKKSSIDNNKRYSLLSILNYNITLEPDDIKNFIITFERKSYLNIVKNIDAINFEKTINMFQDLNELLLIYYEKSHELKKINPNNCTKKVYLQKLSNKKTLKKRYKE